MKTRALGFVDGMTALEELKQRVAAGHHEFAIMLGGGLAISRKTVNHKDDGRWHIVNQIDDSIQVLTDEELWTESHIGEALDKHAFLDLDDADDPLINLGGSMVGHVFFDPLIKRTAPDTEHPLEFRLSDAPGAIRIDDSHGNEGEWEPADPSLLLETCSIGPYTVAQIDLAATAMLSERNGLSSGAATSIELTIEDIDSMIYHLTAIKEDAIANRGFAKRGDYWSNGEE